MDEVINNHDEQLHNVQFLSLFRNKYDFPVQSFEIFFSIYYDFLSD